MNRRKNIIAIIIFIVAAVFIFLMSPQNVQRLQNGFLGLISPFLRTGSDWEKKYKDYRGGLKKLGELEVDINNLRVENDGLKALNQALQGVEAENIRLNAALGFQSQTAFALISARVIGRNPSNWWSTVIIDRGGKDGIQKEMCVLTPKGLVGKVINTTDTTATVLLVTDENCKVAATVKGDGTERQGIVRIEVQGERGSGATHPRMTLNYLSKTPPLQPKQQLLTSGAGYVYPAGIIIGEVLEYKMRELDGYAVIQPAVDFITLKDVFVVTGMKAIPAAK